MDFLPGVALCTYRLKEQCGILAWGDFALAGKEQCGIFAWVTLHLQAESAESSPPMPKKVSVSVPV